MYSLPPLTSLLSLPHLSAVKTLSLKLSAKALNSPQTRNCVLLINVLPGEENEQLYGFSLNIWSSVRKNYIQICCLVTSPGIYCSLTQKTQRNTNVSMLGGGLCCCLVCVLLPLQPQEGAIDLCCNFFISFLSSFIPRKVFRRFF